MTLCFSDYQCGVGGFHWRVNIMKIFIMPEKNFQKMNKHDRPFKKCRHVLAQLAFNAMCFPYLISSEKKTVL